MRRAILIKRFLLAIAMLFGLFVITTTEMYFVMPPAARAQTNTFCASNLACTVTGVWTFQGSITGSTINNLIYVEGVAFPRTNTGIQAALTAAAAQSGGTVYLTA